MKKFKSLYLEKINPDLMKNFGLKNLHQTPKLLKITINRGLGIKAQNTKILKSSVNEIRLISGQAPNVTKSKKAIAGFKIRDDMELGIKITLRGKKMYSFLDKLINLALPRIRDFRGLDPKKFDKNGNYNFGINDQLIFPEIEYESVDQTMGFDINFVTSAKNSMQGIALLKGLGIPFHN